MRESTIQQWLVAHLERGDLSRLIDRGDTLEEATAGADDETYIARFPIDYLVRRRGVVSAHRALHALTNSILVAERKNISFTHRETLYPDAVLYNEELGCFTLIEVKADGKSEREAITELLAYEHELKNHFPFLSSKKIFFVLISTAFTVLLDHSVATCMAWDAKQFLCLHLNASDADWRLRVHLPSSWQAIGQMGLPKESLSTLTIRAKPLPETDTARFTHVVQVAAEMVVREADRANAHGFLVFWRDLSSPEVSQLGITIGIIDSHKFLPAAESMGLIARKDELIKYFQDRPAPPSDSELRGYAYLAGAVLQSHCSFELASVVPWEVAFKTLRDTCRPLNVDFWGNLGEAVREQLLRPAIRERYAPEIEAYGLTWKDPRAGIPFLLEVCGQGVFQLGEYSCGDTFRFGRLTGELLAICARIESSADRKSTAIAASFAWRCLEFTHAFREVRWRYQFASDEVSAPPIVVLGSTERAAETRDSLVKFASWFEDDFLGNKNRLQAKFFRLGMLHHALFDQLFLHTLDSASKALMVQELCAVSIQSLELCIELAAKFDDFPQAYPFVLRELEKHYSISAKPDASKENLLHQLRSVSPELHVRMFLGPLFDIIDFVVLPAALPFADFPISAPDWEWLRAQIAQLRSVGVRLPAVGVSADGTIGTMELSDFPLQEVSDVDNMVLFFDNRRWPPMVFQVQWDDLASGAAFRFREMMPEVPRPSYTLESGKLT